MLDKEAIIRQIKELNSIIKYILLTILLLTISLAILLIEVISTF